MCLGAIATIEEVWDEGGMPMCRVRLQTGAEETACLMYHPDLTVGTWVLVHLSFVLDPLDPELAEAAAALRAEIAAGGPDDDAAAVA